jgi:hypothetical protein
LNESKKPKESEGSETMESFYRIKGIPINVYLDETGEFRWVPTSCTDEKTVKKALEVLRKMPDDRRDVWGARLDREDTMARCPIIKNEPELSKEFNEFCAAHEKNRRNPKRINQQQEGGENNK